MDKLLKTVFVILLLVFVGEMAYLFYSSYYNKPASKSGEKAVLSLPQFDLTDPAQSAANKTWKLFKDAKAGNTADLAITYSNVGTLEKLDFEKQPIPTTLNPSIVPKEMDAVATVRLDSGEIREYYYFGSEVERFHYYQRNGEELSEIDKNDIKIGDRVTFSQTLSFLKPASNNLVEVKVIRE